MKVDNGQKPRIERADKSKGKKKAQKASGSKESAPAERSDSVDVSDQADTLQLIKSLVDNSPEVRVGEVERIMGEIKGGRYKVDFEKVAEGFIKEAIENEMARRMGKN